MVISQMKSLVNNVSIKNLNDFLTDIIRAETHTVIFELFDYNYEFYF